MTSQKKTIREWRAYRKFTKKEVALSIGIHQSTYSKWEDNPSDIRIADIPRLAEAFQCHANEIIFLKTNRVLNSKV